MAKPTKGDIRKLARRMREDLLGLGDALRDNRGRNAMVFICDLQRVARATRDLIGERYPEANPVEEDEEEFEEDDEIEEGDDELEEGEEDE